MLKLPWIPGILFSIELEALTSALTIIYLLTVLRASMFQITVWWISGLPTVLMTAVQWQQSSGD